MNNYINTTAPAAEQTAKIIPAREKFAELEWEISKLAELQEVLISRLGWLTMPYDPAPEDICEKIEHPDSEIVYRLKKSIRNLKELRAKLEVQLDYLDV
jgi:hypothetical protein